MVILGLMIGTILLLDRNSNNVDDRNIVGNEDNHSLLIIKMIQSDDIKYDNDDVGDDRYT